MLVIAALPVPAWAVLYSYWLLWSAWPLIAGLAVSHGACLLLGLWFIDRRRKRQVSEWLP